MRACTSGVSAEGFVSALIDDPEGFTSASPASNAWERSVMSSREGVGVGCHGRGFEEEGVRSCVMKEDGDFVEAEGVFGEKDSEVTLQNLKRFDNQVCESI